MSHMEPKRKVLTTRGVRLLLQSGALPPKKLYHLVRGHLSGNWGDMSEEDRRINDECLASGDTIMSEFVVDKVRIWLITDSLETTVLLPSEF